MGGAEGTVIQKYPNPKSPSSEMKSHYDKSQNNSVIQAHPAASITHCTQLQNLSSHPSQTSGFFQAYLDGNAAILETAV